MKTLHSIPIEGTKLKGTRPDVSDVVEFAIWGMMDAYYPNLKVRINTRHGNVYFQYRRYERYQMVNFYLQRWADQYNPEGHRLTEEQWKSVKFI